jgi:hypothetical protein
MRLALTLVLALAACTQPRSVRCKQVCAREYECATSTSSPVPFDEKECMAACSALEADPDSTAKVQAHYECVTRQQACPAVLECK